MYCIQTSNCLNPSDTSRNGSLTIHQDVDIYAAKLVDEQIEHLVSSDRDVWVQIIDGEVEVAGEGLSAGDGIGFTGRPSDWTLRLRAPRVAHALVLDMTINADKQQER